MGGRYAQTRNGRIEEVSRSGRPAGSKRRVRGQGALGGRQRRPQPHRRQVGECLQHSQVRKGPIGIW